MRLQKGFSYLLAAQAFRLFWYQRLDSKKWKKNKEKKRTKIRNIKRIQINWHDQKKPLNLNSVQRRKKISDEKMTWKSNTYLLDHLVQLESLYPPPLTKEQHKKKKK